MALIWEPYLKLRVDGLRCPVGDHYSFGFKIDMCLFLLNNFKLALLIVLEHNFSFQNFCGNLTIW